jgi:Pyruvate/2-oxoacid:ferredoxin oxidoreductase delta subunit
MIEIKDKKNCCGCSACANSCPKKCITMVEDEEGFLYPQTDMEKCVDCGICNNVCLYQNPIKQDKLEQRAILFQHSDQKILKESTSGGLFTAIASWIIKQDGVVFGAAYDENFVIHHEGVTNVEDLAKFRNSKYAQSVIGESYIHVQKFLKQGRWVLFSGTPCQLEGLHLFLRKKYEKLVLVDIVCHACPSPKVFSKYIEVIRTVYNKDIKNIKFRDKVYGYKYSLMTFYDHNNLLWYKEGIDTDVMMRAFFNNISPRPSCFSCPSKKQYRITDFTIWDCFDVDKFSKDLDNDKGVTRSLLHTSKAFMIWEDIKKDGHTIDVPVENAIEGVNEMFHSVEENPQREAFFHDLNTMPAIDVFQKYFPITIRHQLEKQARLWSNRLGIYTMMKKIFKKIHGNREIKR